MYDDLKMNLADPELEFTDPTPNVHALFMHFDTLFFWAKLSGKAVVRWSKRMYSCAGVCSYEGRGGICDIALSEPLLKLRPRKDLCETLLHEMIHAYLFIINRDQSRDGHGPNFLAHMHRINKVARLNISIYHDFHDEVKLYQTHFWRCSGICQKLPPYFGVVRRSMNRAPGPTDFWWKEHMRKCGGMFVKFKEPEKPAKKSSRKVTKPIADITQYINNNKPIKNKNTDKIISKDNVKGLKDILNEKTKTINNKVTSPTLDIRTSVFTGTGHSIGGNKNTVFPKPIVKPAVFTDNSKITSVRGRSNSVGVLETVRNIWANKTIPSAVTKKVNSKSQGTNASKKRLSDNVLAGSPPNKLKKIDDYFKATATSILKDVYGEDFHITQSKDTNKLKAVQTKKVNDTKNDIKQTLVECPICKTKVTDIQINTHIDECLNKDVIEQLSKETIVVQPSTSQTNTNQETKKRRDTVGVLAVPDYEPLFKPKQEIEVEIKSDELKYNKTPITIIDLQQNPDAIVQVEDVTKSNEQIKVEPGTSKGNNEQNNCPCCGNTIDKPVQEHLDECLMFFDNKTTIPEEGASTSFGDRTIVIDDSDDEFDETQIFNATGTKSPCPCCMKMIENSEMNDHLDLCLGLKD